MTYGIRFDYGHVGFLVFPCPDRPPKKDCLREMLALVRSTMGIMLIGAYGFSTRKTKHMGCSPNYGPLLVTGSISAPNVPGTKMGPKFWEPPNP